LRGISKKSYSFPWDQDDPAKREKAAKRWAEWAAEKDETHSDADTDEGPAKQPQSREPDSPAPSRSIRP
ncbi:MAG: hypothetical protein KDC38_20115, partial [Planctomycetes bacterium]|nr:hypothetical protein [Planctomycetota bacterium]